MNIKDEPYTLKDKRLGGTAYENMLLETKREIESEQKERVSLENNQSLISWNLSSTWGILDPRKVGAFIPMLTKEDALSYFQGTSQDPPLQHPG